MSSSGSKGTSISKIISVAPPELRALLKTAHEQGFSVIKTHSGRFKVTTPPGREKQTVFSSSTPSDIRVVQDVKRKLRGIGVRFGR